MIGMILAGGTGSRLWPFSRTMSPKQFLNLGSSHESLLQETVRRLSPLFSEENIFIIGSVVHELELYRQLEQLMPDFPNENILLEPLSLNTAPAILWGLTRIPRDQWDEPLVILPADHLIQNKDRFLKQLRQGEELARKGWIVTFGVQPDHPDTGYGYIKSGKPLETGHEVAEFIEKPPLEKAKEYIASTKYSWNAGIFMVTPKSLLKEYQKLCPDMYALFFDNSSVKESLAERETIEDIFNRIEPDSFDYAILEKSDRVAVLTIDVGWNDLGSWESIYRKSPKDKSGNVTRGNVILQDSENCLIFSDKRLITCVGLKNLIIIETHDALLACDLTRSQDVKQLVETLKREDRFEYKFHTTVLRPWGNYTILSEGSGYQIKTITVLPEKRLSLQRHFHRSEHWVVVSGTAEVTRGEETFFLTENESTYISKTTPHRLKNPGKTPLEIIEVQQGSYLNEDDIERFEDDFGRSTTDSIEV
ncbi:MAG: mannose-1-phosphate guanylyltransferase/mannose-6-phosphate isomerase [Proteobacteria bacterium]|nr:mannose-1-phosphate guanylyltransferase/mannose-6-phosphate isomerase [Pseudomonadota bacterium]